jgi:hypothetical protein
MDFASRSIPFMKMIAFWDTAPCIMVVVDRRFRGAYFLHHQGDSKGSLTCRKTSYGAHGFTSPPTEGVLRTFIAPKNLLLSPGSNPRALVPMTSTLTTRPPRTQSAFRKRSSSHVVIQVCFIISATDSLCKRVYLIMTQNC